MKLILKLVSAVSLAWLGLGMKLNETSFRVSFIPLI